MARLVASHAPTQVLERPRRSDKFFSWGEAPDRGAGGARSLRGHTGGLVAGDGGGRPPSVEAAEMRRAEPQTGAGAAAGGGGAGGH